MTRVSDWSVRKSDSSVREGSDGPSENSLHVSFV